MKTPTLIELFKAGAHFGHKSSKWHPNMGPYIFTTKNNVHIINLEETQKKLEEALNVLKELGSTGKTVLFVGTKRQAAALVEKYAKACNMPYISTRWLGGMLTNFKTVSSIPRKLTKLKRQREAGELKKYTKKERLGIDREIDKMEHLVGGIEQLEKLPDALFIVDLKEEKTALREVLQLGIPIIAICDTNVNPTDIDYPIPANDDATRSLELIIRLVSEAIQEGQKFPVSEEKLEKVKAAEKTVGKSTEKKVAAKAAA